ncbi:MAG TPA: DUF5106 domain-containing protein [Chitinophagaceae bacterium]|nr:DUF5106 domain-containing protein [Chitinophagaceae bacterium]
MRSILLVLSVLLLSAQGHAQGHHIRVKITGWKDTLLYLGNYYGEKTYLADSSRLDAQGVAIFSGEKKYPEGIYFLLMPDKRHFFELLMGKDQDFSVTADTADLAGKTIFSHSPDNSLFSRYNHFLATVNSRSVQIAGEMHQAANHADSSRALQDRKDLNESIYQFRKQFIHDHPGSLLARIFRAMLDPTIPTAPKLPDGHPDSSFAFRYMKIHYWDNVDFSDSALLRTPIYEGRLQDYFTHYVMPFPDSINAAADLLLKKTMANREMFKFTLSWLTYTYETSRYMGMDAVFFHLVEKYYVPGDATWLTHAQQQKIIERAYSLSANLIGEKAPALDLLDSTMQHRISLYGIHAKYTLIVFWDPTCGHCQVDVPRMDSAYEKAWKKMGMKVLAVRTGGTREQWLNFIHVHHLNNWINAWDPRHSSHYRQLYNVYMTPVVYLLNSKKIIIAKQLDVKGLSDFLRLRSRPAGG